MTRRCIGWLFVLAATSYGCAQPSPEVQVIHDAADAIGGVDAVRGATAVVMEGRGTTYPLGQNRTPESDPPPSTVESYRLELDLQNHGSRVAVTSANFAGNMGTAVTAMDGTVVYTVGQDGPRRVGSAAARERHILYYHHPLPLLQAALAEGEGMAATVSNLRQEMGHDVVDIRTADGIELSLHVDPETRLPLSISSTSYNPNLGDVVTTTSFSDYRGEGGFRLPQGVSRTLDTFPSTELRVSQTVNGEIRDLSAPGDVAAAEPGAPARERDGRGAFPGSLVAGWPVASQRARRVP